MNERQKQDHLVQAVTRSLRILEAIGGQKETGICELSKTVGMTASTAHRLVTTLRAAGYVVQNPGTEKYSLSVRLFELGNRAIGNLEFLEVVRPYLRMLADRTGETAFLGILVDGDVIYIDKIESGQVLQVSVLGRRAPAYSTAIGKVLLANLPPEQRAEILARNRPIRHTATTIATPEELERHLEQVQARGYAIHDEEFYEGVRSVAGPVFDQSGTPVAGMSVAWPTVRISRERLDDFGPLISEIALEASAALGYTRPNTLRKNSAFPVSQRRESPPHQGR